MTEEIGEGSGLHERSHHSERHGPLCMFYNPLADEAEIAVHYEPSEPETNASYSFLIKYDKGNHATNHTAALLGFCELTWEEIETVLDDVKEQMHR